MRRTGDFAEAGKKICGRADPWHEIGAMHQLQKHQCCVSVAFAFDCKLSACLLLGLKDGDSCLLQELVSAEFRVVAGIAFHMNRQCRQWRSN